MWVICRLSVIVTTVQFIMLLQLSIPVLSPALSLTRHQNLWSSDNMPSFVNSVHFTLIKMYFFLNMSGSQKCTWSLFCTDTRRTHFMAVLRVTWLRRATILQMYHTCLMLLNHDKVNFMRKPESTQPNSRELQGHN